MTEQDKISSEDNNDYFFDELIENDNCLCSLLVDRRIVYIQRKLYYYRTRRNGSITQSVDNDAAWLKASEQQAEELIELGYSDDKAQTNMWITALKCCGRAKSVDDPVYKEASNILERVKGIPSRFSLKEKLMFIIWLINKSLYRTAYRLAKR